MKVLHTANDDRPTVTLLVDSAYDLRVAGLLEDERDTDIADDELDARGDRNERRTDTYEAAWLEALSEIGRERDITVQVTWDPPEHHQATGGYCSDGAEDGQADEGEGPGKLQLTQSVYQEACDRAPVPSIESVTVRTGPRG